MLEQRFLLKSRADFKSKVIYIAFDDLLSARGGPAHDPVRQVSPAASASDIHHPRPTLDARQIVHVRRLVAQHIDQFTPSLSFQYCSRRTM